MRWHRNPSRASVAHRDFCITLQKRCRAITLRKLYTLSTTFIVRCEINTLKFLLFLKTISLHTSAVKDSVKRQLEKILRVRGSPTRSCFSPEREPAAAKRLLPASCDGLCTNTTRTWPILFLVSALAAGITRVTCRVSRSVRGMCLLRSPLTDGLWALQLPPQTHLWGTRNYSLTATYRCTGPSLSDDEAQRKDKLEQRLRRRGTAVGGRTILVTLRNIVKT